MEQSAGLQECKGAQGAGMMEYRGQREQRLCTFDGNAGLGKRVHPVSQGDQVF